MNCADCGATLVNGSCPNVANHRASDPMTEVAGALRELVTSNQAHNTAVLEEIRALRPVVAPPGEPDPDPDLLPGGRVADVRVADPFEQMGYTRADFELAAVLLAGGAAAKKVRYEPSDEFVRAWRHHLFENPEKFGPAPLVRLPGANGTSRIRAMDTAETGYGLELIGTAYEASMWLAARNRDPLLSLVQEVEVRENSQIVPIDGALPEMMLVSENTDSTVGTKYTTTKTASQKVTQSPKKFTIQELWSGEVGEDSIVPWVPFLRGQLTESFRLHLASAFYNGDTTNAATGNINRDDADPADTKHYLAWDGIRHKWLVDATTQGADAAGVVTLELLTEARGRLNGAGNDVDGGLSNIDWSAEVSDLLLICDRDTYYSMIHRLDEVVTAERYGQGATILTGELARIGGMRIISPSYASKTEADGKASDTASNNTKGQISIVNTRGLLAGVRRGVEFYMDRVQGRDQYLLEMYTRRSFNTFSNTVAAGLYNITV